MRMRNRFTGPCYRCGEKVLPDEGYFERHNGGWRTQHIGCAKKYRGTDHEFCADPTPSQPPAEEK